MASSHRTHLEPVCSRSRRGPLLWRPLKEEEGGGSWNEEGAGVGGEHEEEEEEEEKGKEQWAQARKRTLLGDFTESRYYFHTKLRNT